jgi:excisionase family DNA binding protein
VNAWTARSRRRRCGGFTTISHESLRTHLATFLGAYNFGKRLKSLLGLTPFERICQLWTEEPKRFKLSPIHHTPGLNILASTRSPSDTTINGVAMETEQGTASERWITIMRACEVAGVSRRTIYSWIEMGRVTTRRTAGGSTRILESSLFRVDGVGSPQRP